MKFTFIESKDKEEIIAYSKEKSNLISKIESLCLEDNNKIIAYSNHIIKELNPIEIECFYTENEKVYALYQGKTYQIKKRLYELNKQLNNTFIYINQSCLANIDQIDHFDASIGGALMVVFKSGYKDYVSRRQIKNVKERLGI